MTAIVIMSYLRSNQNKNSVRWLLLKINTNIFMLSGGKITDIFILFSSGIANTVSGLVGLNVK